ncbi:nuclear transport factor 2 family protein [Sphingosinicella microcystinivorans]|uniref:nuclear transport factor 2 family protein n=1 Tax=Sphingosinicella microcystinivorans TaxID=335406 RepID=UPI0022F40021|nr:nuclear transport factor 2 family protein [Sphingosinicella microcystinivorans]WBX85784.1 nuclear transport factor 2 family protein [Sphingosinicella microcystinivorans]
MLNRGTRLAIISILLTWGSTAMAQTSSETAEAWRQKTIEAFRQARPTPELAKMSAVDKLLAIEEIRQIPLRYTRCINQRDWKCWTALFTEESDYWNGTLGKVVSGTKGWHDHLVATGMTSSRVHSLFHSYGTEIEVLSPTTARGIWQASFVFYSGKDEPGDPAGTVIQPGQQMRHWAVYYQTYRKVDSVWKINSNIHLDVRGEYGPLREGVKALQQEIPPNPEGRLFP